MLIREARKYFNQEIHPTYTPTEANALFDRIAEHLCGLSRLEQLKHSETKIDVKRMQNILDELITGKPIQYILGYEWFMGMKLEVDQNVLIPRPETAELVTWIIEHIHARKSDNPLTLVDLGTGSGCIAISIKKNIPALQVYGLDISEAALNIAQKNATRNDIQLDWVEANMLNGIPESLGMVDIIVSNPPYISLEEFDALATQVRDHEPALALFVPDQDPLCFYKAIIKIARKRLRPHGEIFLELHSMYALETQQLFVQAGFNPTLRRDIFGHQRFLHAFYDR